MTSEEAPATLEKFRGRIASAIHRTIQGTEQSVPVAAITANILRELQPDFEALMKMQYGLGSNSDYMLKPLAPAVMYVATNGATYTLDQIDWAQGGLGGRELAILRALLQWSTDSLEYVDG